ncbi:hypothetical protein HKX48_006093 [Thoreauomyces humboldtii]|nr:hypothetical protein HKX48_006093 [Thoreauomyces humboldtii]
MDGLLDDSFSSSRFVEMYLHQKYYFLADKSDQTFLNKKRMVRMTGVRAVTTPTGRTRLLPSEHMVFLISQTHDAPFIRSSFGPALANLPLVQPQEPSGVLVTVIRIDAPRAAKATGRRKRVDVSVCDTTGEFATLVLWDEQIGLASLFAKVALSVQIIEAVGLVTEPIVPVCLCYGSNETPKSDHDPLRHPERMYIAELAPKMMNVTLVGRVLEVVGNNPFQDAIGSGKSDRYGIRLADDTGRCDITLWDDFGRTVVGNIRCGDWVMIENAATTECVLASATTRRNRFEVVARAELGTVVRNIGSTLGMITSPHLRRLQTLSEAIMTGRDCFYARAVVTSCEPAASDHVDAGAAVRTVHRICGRTLVFPEAATVFMDADMAWEDAEDQVVPFCGFCNQNAKDKQPTYALRVVLGDGTAVCRVDVLGKIAVDLLGVSPSVFAGLSSSEQRAILDAVVGRTVEACVVMASRKEGHYAMATASTSRTSHGYRAGAEDVFVEITDPQTGRTFFANLATGECSWERPAHGRVKPKDDSGIEWWELFDDNHKLPYYYNTRTGETEWMRPTIGTIIPLSAIQNSSIGKRVSVLVTQQSLANSFSPLSAALAGSHAGRQSYMHFSSGAPTYQHGISEESDSIAGNTRSPLSPLGRSSRTDSQSDVSAPSSPTIPSQQQQQQNRGNFKTSSSNNAINDVPSPVSATSAHRKTLSSSSASLSGGAASRARTYGISTPVLNPEAAAAMNPIHKHNMQSTPQLNRPQMSKQEQKLQLPGDLKAQLSQFRIQGFAEKYFSEHKKGIFFRRTVPVEKMLVYQKDALKTPLMVLNKNLHKDALKCFKNIQKIMKSDPPTVTAETQALLEKGILFGGLRDEIYVQICKQLKSNPEPEGVYRGWILLCVITIAFPPSKNFEEYLKSFVQENQGTAEGKLQVVIYHCWKKLVRICRTGPRGKTPTIVEITRAQEAPFSPSLFGEPLDDIMKLELEREPHAVVPRILPFLADAIIALKGCSTEGIFRVPGDADAVTELRMRVEKGDYNMHGITDPNVPSSLLKLWLRDLADPLIPSEFYPGCVQVGKEETTVPLSESGPAAVKIVSEMPDANQAVIRYMVQFLRVVAEPQNQPITKMSVSNLAMVFAPNFLRNPSENPQEIFESTRYEQAFLRILISYRS